MTRSLLGCFGLALLGACVPAADSGKGAESAAVAAAPQALAGRERPPRRPIEMVHPDAYFRAEKGEALRILSASGTLIKVLISKWAPDAPADLTANLWLFGGQGGGICAATTVGPRSVITAAHCLGGATEAVLTQGDRTIPATCDPTPGFAGDGCQAGACQQALDVAICTSKEGNLAFGDFKPEALDREARSQSEPGRVFGFEDPGVTGAQQQAAYIQIDMSWPTNSGPSFEGHFLHSSQADTRRVTLLEMGDSGGPFAMESSGKRRVVGVLWKADNNIAYGAALSASATSSFLASYNKAPLCGVTLPNPGECP